MNYSEAADFLFDLRRFQVKPGTESVRALLDHLGDPHENVRFVQVAGSNGKGSTARMVESTLREAGCTVGLYTSPHFDSLRERVRVDGRKMPESALCAFVEEAKPYLVDRAAAGEPLTFFETVTALGLWYFGREDVDVAVLEVGMGGELDATSVVDPVASAVTNVTLEHTAVLGDTIEEIATTKAHVAPADRPLVTATTGAALDAVRAQAGDVLTVSDPNDADAPEKPDLRVSYEGRVNHTESVVTVAQESHSGAASDSSSDSFEVDARVPMLGAYQAKNAGVAVALSRQAADEVGVELDTETVARGLRNAHWPGRFEVMSREPMVVLDGAHNPGAFEVLASVLSEFDYENLHLVFGAMHDKDHREMAAALPTPESVTTCRPNLSRAEDPEILARVFERAGVDSVDSIASVSDALSAAVERADPDDCVLLTGSLFCVAEARRQWTRLEIPKSVDSSTDAREVLERAGATTENVDDAQNDVVHRVVKTQVESRQARVLETEMARLGGECVSSGLDSDGELHDVVLSGTLAQFERLLDSLDGHPYGLSDVAADLRERLELAKSDGSEGGEEYPWTESASVMGILNVTPDSFHDGGEFFDADAAIERAQAMVDAGADIVDVGGESTRPGADPVSTEDEINRVVPVIEAISDLDVAISVDTRRAEVGRAALDAGADILNDVTGLEDPEMRFLAAEREVPVIVMHSIDAPVVPDRDVEYDDVVEDVIEELNERVLLAEKAGIPRERVVVDPGLGFGKSKVENFELLSRLSEFEALGCPILVGHSHKSMFELVGQKAGDNLDATVAATALAVDRGADIVRVHDVPENVAAVRVAEATKNPSRFE
ncbi:dihydropteroate synthase [Haloprofundus marisrubri]|uniref:Probable bifunctional folylpolyglutamate synthase/dihydropteroate synthase n=1 Tax=Haloprofundus marisrubri TaxID=1514971 RepID=A0A0W1R921_9EURY|nr:dihydropteroate synthase [Haloprofundus marisrubri]KTG09905.1 dihydropteroate synthase [Haloprofundus marisrubri]